MSNLQKLQDLCSFEFIINEYSFFIYKFFFNSIFQRTMPEKFNTEEALKFKTPKKFFSFVCEEITIKFPRLNFYKNSEFIVEEEDEINHLKIVSKEDYTGTKIHKNGVEEIYSAFKYVFNVLNIDFNR